MLDRPGLAIRLRDPWEAVDLGFVLLRVHWRTAMTAWLAVVAPLSIALFLAFRNHLWVPPLVVWWLKPILDRVVLHVLAKATFGEVPSLGDTLRKLPSLLKHGCVASLLWRRFSPQRSFVLPVWQLEEQSGTGYRRRCAVLLRRGQAQAVCLTAVCLLFHATVFFGALGALSLFAPAQTDLGIMDAAFGSGSDRLPWLDACLAVLPILAATFLEPFYVAGGFLLYLNRRVELEGWDLEVSFRATAARVACALGRGAAVLLLALLFAWPSAAQAQPPARPTPEEALAEVLKQPEFQVKQRKKGLRWKEQANRSPRDRSIPPGLLAFFRRLGGVAKWAIIAAAAGALAYVLWRNRLHLARRLHITSEEPLPEALFGLDIRPEALPADPGRAAAVLWAEGRVREALALLYRGSLAHLVHARRAAISQGATESDCLRKAREILPEASADYFARLTRAWLRAAYADLAPDEGSEGLCPEWALHFGNDAGGRP